MGCYGHKLSNGVLFAHHLILDVPGGSSHLGYRRRVAICNNPGTRVKWQYHHLFTLSARSYTIPRNFCDAFSTPVAINLIRFRDFGERLIGEDARGSSSKGLLVYPPLVLAATVCGYDRTRYVARTVQQLLLASTTRRRDGSRRNKREKA